MPPTPDRSLLRLPADVDRRLSEGADVLAPLERLETLRHSYPASRIDALDPRALAGLTQVDVVILEGPLTVDPAPLHLLLAIHVSLRPGGTLVLLPSRSEEALLRDAGFVHAERHCAWTAHRSSR